MRVLVANEPVAYREVISGTFKVMRSHLEVRTAEPANLDEEFLRYAPSVVVCSRVTTLIEQEAAAWIELYPEHASKAIVYLAGEKMTFKTMPFEVLLSILDEAEHLYGSI